MFFETIIVMIKIKQEEEFFLPIVKNHMVRSSITFSTSMPYKGYFFNVSEVNVKRSPDSLDVLSNNMPSVWLM